MDNDMSNYGSPRQSMAEGAGDVAQNVMGQGAEAYGQAEKKMSEAYDKTTQKVSETYGKAKRYCDEHPAKTIAMALGVGVGVGLLLSVRHKTSHNYRIAKPVVNALSDIALEFFH